MTTEAIREHHQYETPSQGAQLTLEIEPKALSPLARRSPYFYDFQTGKWNHKQFRISSVYRLLRKQIIGKACALELLAQRHSAKEMRTLRATVELWQMHSIKDMLP
jgi:hypothetical protein